MFHHLPEPELVGEIGLTRRRVGALDLAFPTPGTQWLAELARALHGQYQQATLRPVADIVGILDDVNARWADPSSPQRQEADGLLAAATGYPAAVIRPALDHLFTGLRRPQLLASLIEELGDPRALDTWVERPALGTRSKAFGPRLTLVVASGNVPMAAIPSIVYSLLTKSSVLVKLSSDEPVLAGLYLRSLAAADEALGRSCAAVWWSGGDEAIEAAVLSHVEAVIAFGGDITLRSLASRLPPHVRFRPHGHRIGFALVGRERLNRAGLPSIAAAVARDVAEFDQQGCVAPQRLFVERGGGVSPQQLAEAIAAALSDRATDWPRTLPPPATSAAIHQLRAAASVRSALDPGVALFDSSGGTDWTVVLDPECGFGPGCLYRTLIVHPVDDLADVPKHVAPFSAYLQSAAAAVDEARLSELAVRLGQLGVTRVCTLGLTQRPAAGWRPDGRPRLAELVRWVDWETE